MDLEKLTFERIYMNKKQLCAYLGISIAKVDRLIRDKKIPYSRIDRRIIFMTKDIDEWVESHKVA